MLRRRRGLLAPLALCAAAAAAAADGAPGGQLGKADGSARRQAAAAARGAARLTMLPQDAGEASPACLDGSPYGLFFRPSPTNSTKWTIFIQGGGWCYDEALCLQRSKTAIGSSKAWHKSTECVCMNAKEDGTMDEDCNCVYLPYCDGASFSGFRPKPWPVPGESAEVYFRGIKNLDAALEFAFEHGMESATEFLLTGESAGGLATFLHADRVAGRVARRAPGVQVLRAAPNVGFFLDHDDAKHDASNYTAFMKYVYGMQNLTFGPDGGLDPACGAAFPDRPHYCFMSPHMHTFVKTPFFVFNSKYDAWQLDNELKTRDPASVLPYGEDFMRAFQPLMDEPRGNGASITTCVCHPCRVDVLEVSGKTMLRQYADWYVGRTRGAAAFHVDPRHPNGDGKLQPPLCKKLAWDPEDRATPVINV